MTSRSLPSPPSSFTASAVSAVAALADPTRRRLYDYVASADGAVGRDEAASALAIGRPLAAFHLDRLVTAGLLDAEYRRLSGRSGPGAGRPAKLYRRSARSTAVSLPARRYDIAAALFAAALEALEPAEAPAGLLAAAQTLGTDLGRQARADRGDGASPGNDGLVETLAGLGFEPEIVLGPDGSADVVRLRNCPFDAIARSHRAVTCAMNFALLEGIGCGLGTSFVPRPGGDERHCCVEYCRTAGAAAGE